MTFNPDTDLNFQAYLFARGGGSTPAADATPPFPLTGDDLAAFDLGFIQWVCTQMTAGATLVNNGGTRFVPTGSILTAINAGLTVARVGTRSF